MKIQDRVHVVKQSDLTWSMDKQLPSYKFDPKFIETWSRSVDFDPFPCYTHDPVAFATYMELVESKFPVSNPPSYYLMGVEHPHRCNAQTNYLQTWENDKPWGPKELEAFVVVSGKRTPPHPAMTHYLAGHEYGHVVQMQIQHWRGEREENALLDEYCRVRQMERKVGYGNCGWHLETGEVFACDFRILVCGIQPEVWPHDPIQHPDSVSGLREWWDDWTQRAAQYHSNALVNSESQ